MGYFSNGTEGDYYFERYCSKCVHNDEEKGCPVWLAHLLYSYQLCNEKEHPGKHILDLLIPETKDGLGNDQCAMFHESTDAARRYSPTFGWIDAEPPK